MRGQRPAYCRRRQNDPSYLSCIQEHCESFPGLAEDAQKDDAELLQPTTDTVTYKDGLSDEVYGFDVPVEALDQDFDLAIIGTKGKWYDHTVSVSNPEEMNDDNKLPVEVAEDEAEDTENAAEDTEDAE